MKNLLFLSVFLLVGCGSKLTDGEVPLPAKIEATIGNARVQIVQKNPGEDSYSVAVRCYDSYDLGARKLVGEARDCTEEVVGKATFNTDLQSILNLALDLSKFRCVAPE